jgi:DNA-binding NarL/FixJ family response regulator
MTTKLVVVDDQELVRAGFVALLASSPDLEVVGEAGQGEEAVRLVAEELPDVVLMDVRMPVLDGIEATKRILADPRTTHVRVIVLTTFAMDEYVFGALRAGAVGFLVKDTPPAELLRAVQVAAAGDALLSPSVTKRLIEAFASTPTPQPTRPTPDLTAREGDILMLVARGLSNAEIADQLHLGIATVKTYVSKLLEKLSLNTRTHLVIHAYESGLIPHGPPAHRPGTTPRS